MPDTGLQLPTAKIPTSPRCPNNDRGQPPAGSRFGARTRSAVAAEGGIDSSELAAGCKRGLLRGSDPEASAAPSSPWSPWSIVLGTQVDGEIFGAKGSVRDIVVVGEVGGVADLLGTPGPPVAAG